MLPFRSLATSLTLILSVFVGTAANAQVIRGQVVDSLSGTSIGYGFIILANPDGREVTRTLANASGHFSVQISPGEYRLRSLRIGFRESDAGTVIVHPGDTLNIRVPIRSIPIAMAPITVTENERCSIEPDIGRLAATAWFEVQKALEATEWVARTVPLTYEMAVYMQDLDENAVLREETRDTIFSRSIKPFDAAPPEDLETNGYIQWIEGDSVSVFGLDATVLLSDIFVTHHCFTINQESTSELVGLEFYPIGDGLRVPNVKGVLWLRRDTWELQHLTFDFVGVPIYIPVDFGGRVDFDRLETGEWIVREWWLRIPDVERLNARSLTPREKLHGYSQQGARMLNIIRQ